MTRASAPDFWPGEMLPGTKYRVVRKLAAGGMGVLLEVIKEPQIRGVAKLMGTAFLDDDGFRKRFIAEAQILAQLDHPNIVRIFDYDTLQDGRPFFVMELLRGKPLDVILGEHKTLPPRVAYRVVRQLLSALECAHTHDSPVVHRDVKPANLFVHKPKHGESSIKLLDFGIMASLDKQTIMAGTHGYMAPEQLSSGTVTARTDVYASAVVLYEMLVGHGPFPLQESMGTEALARATLEAPAERITRYAKWVPEGVASAIARALDKDPRQRPASALAFLDALAELDRIDLFGADVEIPWLRDESTPRMTAASLTAVAGPNLDSQPDRHPFVGQTRRLDTFASHQSDASRRARGRDRDAARWRWILACAAGTIALACTLIILGMKWPRANVQPVLGSAQPSPTTVPALASPPAASASPPASTSPPTSARVAPSARATTEPGSVPRFPAPPATRSPTSRPSAAASISQKPGPTFEPTVGD